MYLRTQPLTVAGLPFPLHSAGKSQRLIHRGYWLTKPDTIADASPGFHTLYVAFAVALAIDLILQIYAYFLGWRFKARLEHYYAFRTVQGGEDRLRAKTDRASLTLH